MTAAATRRKGAEAQPRIDPETTICVAVRLDSARFPRPFICPRMAIAATERPWAKALTMLMTGVE